jgi:hypothetical protein
MGRAGETITHHHALGRNHRWWYDRQRPELFARALDAAKNGSIRSAFSIRACCSIPEFPDCP